MIPFILLPIYLNVDIFNTWQLVIPHDKVFDGRSAVCRSPVLLDIQDTRSWYFMVLRRGTSLTVFIVCSRTLQLMEQTQKSCFQGSSSLSTFSGQITKHISQCISRFPYALHEKLDQIFTRQSPQNHDVCWIFWVWPAIHQMFIWDQVSHQRVQPRTISAFSCPQPVIYPVGVPTSDSPWESQVTILQKDFNSVGTECFKPISWSAISACWIGF